MGKGELVRHASSAPQLPVFAVIRARPGEVPAMVGRQGTASQAISDHERVGAIRPYKPDGCLERMRTR